MAVDRRETPENRTDLRTLTLTLTVSLFIAMLAFFIILNSYASDSQQKLTMAQSSLSNTFGLIGEGRALNDIGGKGTGTAGDMEVATSAAMRSVLPDIGFQASKNSSGHTMNVQVSTGAFAENWPELRSRIAYLMTTLNPAGYKLQVISLNGSKTNIPELASTAAGLEEDGMNADDLSVGIEDRGRDVIELRFVGGRR